VFKEFAIVIIILQFFKLKFVRVYCATVINIIEQFDKWFSLHIMTSHTLYGLYNSSICLPVCIGYTYIWQSPRNYHSSHTQSYKRLSTSAQPYKILLIKHWLIQTTQYMAHFWHIMGNKNIQKISTCGEINHQSLYVCILIYIAITLKFIYCSPDLHPVYKWNTHRSWLTIIPPA
jgi:hypothetical protein